MARTHKGPLAPSRPISRRSSIDSNGGPSTPRATTGGKTMAIIPPPRPTGIPAEGRYGVVVSEAMRAMLEGGKSQGDDEEVVGLKYKFKPASIQPSKRGTLTPNGDGAGGVTVHLEGANERDVHGFAGKVDKDAGGGAAGGDMKEILVVWDEEEQRFYLRPISHTYTLALDKKLALNALPPTQPVPSGRAHVVPPTRSPSPSSSASRSSSPPRPTPPPVHARAPPAQPAPVAPPKHNPLALPVRTQPLPPPAPPAQPQPQRAGKRPLPPSTPAENLSSPPRGRPRVAYGGKTIALPPPSANVAVAGGTSDSDDSSNSDGSDEDDDFAQMLKQELAKEQTRAAVPSAAANGASAMGVAGSSTNGAAARAGPPAGGQVGAKRPPGLGQKPKSLNAMMGVVDDDEDEDDSDVDSSDED